MAEALSRIVAVVKPFRLDAVLAALAGRSVTVVACEEARGYGRQKGHVELYEGSEYSITFLPKMRLELVCPVAATEDVVAAIADAARTGRIGDGKILVMDAEAGAPATPTPTSDGAPA
jgi:nitrogen regulatory protein P-II 1